MKTSELIGPALDWAVAKCEGHKPYFASGYIQLKRWIPGKMFSPSTDWSQGGPIIEREHMDLTCWGGNTVDWFAEGSNNCEEYGPTPLIAAMRCCVLMKLGYEVEVPAELL